MSCHSITPDSRSNGGEWKWTYLDHESTGWGKARIIWNEAKTKSGVDVYRNDDFCKEILLAELDRAVVPEGEGVIARDLKIWTAIAATVANEGATTRSSVALILGEISAISYRVVENE